MAVLNPTLLARLRCAACQGALSRQEEARDGGDEREIEAFAFDRGGEVVSHAFPYCDLRASPFLGVFSRFLRRPGGLGHISGGLGQAARLLELGGDLLGSAQEDLGHLVARGQIVASGRQFGTQEGAIWAWANIKSLMKGRGVFA